VELRRVRRRAGAARAAPEIREGLPGLPFFREGPEVGAHHRGDFLLGDDRQEPRRHDRQARGLGTAVSDLWQVGAMGQYGGDWLRPGRLRSEWRVEVVRRPRKKPGTCFRCQQWLSPRGLTTRSHVGQRRLLGVPTQTAGWLVCADLRIGAGRHTGEMKPGSVSGWPVGGSAGNLKCVEYAEHTRRGSGWNASGRGFDSPRLHSLSRYWKDNYAPTKPSSGRGSPAHLRRHASVAFVRAAIRIEAHASWLHA